ncbi:Di-copper centre-containing protein [Aspergillus costaricaensis CBS 115574]|uniref:Di-copper centre-containing protein n=1 Tax=Aspergillus costaricaensis CBS 115574 TaxID=1448317 RepID=A0ACD1IKL3_9EURO|nr:Di-copper centre-containing protein [Aspergillus costaricaensis CBS 115574]RAK90889.1 Di-copper centre-containing protein [Aspergillus costaricaensis CBS 115574]
MSPFRLRKNIAALEEKERDDLVLAFHLLQKEGPGTAESPNEDSFYTIAGYHGQPFRGAGYGNRDWWGGYCHHGNVLFPTWHRAYVLRLEDALRKVAKMPNLALPYWDEFADSLVPKIFTQRKYTLPNVGEIDNPLYSYKLSQGFFDNLGRIASDKSGTTTRRVDYSKPKKYETVRCPYSGLVGKDDKDATENYNATISEADATKRLNENVFYWLRSPATNRVPGMRQLYINAAWKAPNYTVFSNTTSAAKWNDDLFGREHEWMDDFVVSVERPHNGVHLAVGGYDMPDKDAHRTTPSQANGDMGENDTAAFDPIFFFHHCFIDMVFWLWQFHHEATEKFDIIPFYPGTSPIDSQGPTPGMSADSQLNMETPLTPFRYTSKKLGYTYDCDQYRNKTPPPPIDVLPVPAPPVRALAPSTSRSAVRVTGISRSQRLGSFVVAIWAFPSDNEHDWDQATLVGLEPVFSRWHVPNCANCSNSLTVTLHAHLPPGSSPTDSDKFTDGGQREWKLKIIVLDNQLIKDKEGVPRKKRLLNPITGDSKVDPGPWIEIKKVSG